MIVTLFRIFSEFLLWFTFEWTWQEEWRIVKKTVNIAFRSELPALSSTLTLDVWKKVNRRQL